MAIKFVNGEEAAKALQEKGIKIVNVYATWCGPCQMFAPTLEELSLKHSVFKIDADQNRELAIQMGVSGLPTTFIYKDNVALEKMVGFVPMEALEETLKQHLEG